jgi:hypothetical protein
LGIEKLERRQQSGTDTLAPAALARRRAGDRMRKASNALVERRQDTLFGALESAK